MVHDPQRAVSVVVPVYRAHEHILRSHQLLQQSLERSFGSWEILYVDDCSDDETFRLLQEIQDQCPKVSLIRLTENQGQQRATHCGILHAAYPQVVTIDDDGQSDPGLIAPLYDMLLSGGFDCVFGIPEGRQRRMHRDFGTAAVDRALRYCVGKPRAVQVSSFRCLSERCVRHLARVHTERLYLSAEILLFSSAVGNLPSGHAAHPAPTRYSMKVLLRIFLSLLWEYRRSSGTSAGIRIEHRGAVHTPGREVPS